MIKKKSVKLHHLPGNKTLLSLKNAEKTLCSRTGVGGGGGRQTPPPVLISGCYGNQVKAV